MKEHRVLRRPEVLENGAITSVSIFEKEHTLAISCLVRRHWKKRIPVTVEEYEADTSGDISTGVESWDLPHYREEEWKKNVRGPEVVFSLKNKRLNVYLKEPAGRQRGGRWKKSRISNITNKPQTLYSHFTSGESKDFTGRFARGEYRLCRLLREKLDTLGMDNPLSPVEVGTTDLVKDIYLLAYPIIGSLMLEGYNLVGYQGIPTPYSSFFRGRTPMEVCQRAFGKKASRALTREMMKSLTRQTTGSEEARKAGISTDSPCINLDNFSYALLLKSLVNRDHLQQIFQWEVRVGAGATYGAKDHQDWEGVRDFLKGFDTTRILRLCKEACERGSTGWHLLCDTARMIREYPSIPLPNRIRGLVELHDHVAFEQRRASRPNYLIPVHPKVAKFQGARIDMNLPEPDKRREYLGKDHFFTIRFPRSYYELCLWGAQMRHCIASYGQDAKAGRCLLVGIEREGKLVYNLELTASSAVGPSYFVRQFYGPANTPPDQEDRECIEAWLQTNKTLYKGMVEHKRNEGLVEPTPEEAAAILAEYDHPR